ncbi:hypothetical protein [Nostoc sp. UCD121]|uniref:hypothetical protein n=1 Tax=unclassified Nostoc TaxID=2593658 RepID=UPI0034D9754A
MKRFCKQYYVVIFYTYSMDDNLVKHSYIIPGLGNAGDAYTYWTQNKLITINAVINGCFINH